MSKNEFERIETYFAPLAAGFDGALSLKDDAAVLAVEAGRELVVTTDTIVEGVHYIGDETPDLIARKLLRVSLSDLAAMGADPIAYTLNVALPRGTGDDWLEAFAGGLRADQDAFGIHLAGGDSVSTPGAAVLTATLFGSVPAGMAVRRSGASPGDVIFVSGTMGVSAFGLAAAQGALSADKSDIDALEARYRLPLPRLNLGGCLREIATAAADVSDGLLADLGHITKASGCGAMIELEKIPLSPAVRRLVDEDAGRWEQVVTGGDDYEIVFTGRNESRVTEFSARLGLPITAIGRVTPGKGIEVRKSDGEPISFAAAGYKHA